MEYIVGCLVVFQSLRFGPEVVVYYCGEYPPRIVWVEEWSQDSREWCEVREKSSRNYYFVSWSFPPPFIDEIIEELKTITPLVRDSYRNERGELTHYAKTLTGFFGRVAFPNSSVMKNSGIFERAQAISGFSIASCSARSRIFIVVLRFAWIYGSQSIPRGVWLILTVSPSEFV